MTGIAILVAARARHPGRWLPAILGLTLSSAFAAGVLAETTIASDQAARTVLRQAGPAQRALTLTAQGPGTPGRARRARALLAQLGVPAPTTALLLAPVRLSGVVVRPAALAPAATWIPGAGRLGSCSARDCPVLAVTGRPPAALKADGIGLRVLGHSELRSAVPLGFASGPGTGPPLVVSDDPAGLDRVPGLAGLYRTESWVAVLDLAGLQSWQLAGLEHRLQRAQATLPNGGEFTLSAPFATLDRARAAAAGAPDRLLPAGGGALAALALFVILAAYGLRREREPDVQRLAAAGARSDQRIAFALAEAGMLAALGLLAGFAVGVAVAAGLAHGAGLPAGGVLTRSLLGAAGLGGLLAGWLLATALVTAVLLLPSGWPADVLAVAAAAALALALVQGGTPGSPLPVLVAPLACLGAGVLVFRLGQLILRGLERLLRDGPPLARLSLVALARAPTAPALAIAFVAVSLGLGGFALAYRATLARGQADRAAAQVPLDALVAAGTSFIAPLRLAPLASWRALAGPAVEPVRRTDASLLSGAQAVTVPVLGVPAGALTMISGWRPQDGSAPLSELARRLRGAGPVRTPGPALPGGVLSLLAQTAGGGVVITADLRDVHGDVRPLALGTALPRRLRLDARLPRGRWELEALTLTPPAGLEATNGHQNAESAVAATQEAATVTLSGLRVNRSTVALGSWRVVGAATAAAARSRGALRLTLASSGDPGVIRPTQPWDARALPILTDPATAAAAGPGGRLALTADGLPVSARVVGIVHRFPTVPAGAAGVVIADQASLAGALDASLPGAGSPDELWIDTRHPSRLRAALARPPLDTLTTSWRHDVLAALRADPVAGAVAATLLAAAGVGLALAIAGLLLALVGPLRDRSTERELAVLGLGPRGLNRERRVRVALAAALGLLAGVAIALALTHLAVRAASAEESPGPQLIAVIPWAGLAAGVALTAVLVTAGSWLVTTGDRS